MDKIVESRIWLSDDPCSIVKFKIFYPNYEEIPENSQKFKDFQSNIAELEEKIQEQSQKLFEKSKEMQELLEKNSNLAFELDEKIIEIEELRDFIKKLQNQNESLNKLVDELLAFKESKNSQCNKLQKTLHDIKANRKTAEVLLEKQEVMNKELIDKNVKLEKALQEAEKKNAENVKMIQRLKDEINGTNDNNKQRDENLKSIVKKIKLLETEKLKFVEELRKKEEIIKKLQSNPKETLDPVPQRPKDSKELKKVMDMLSMKDNEIKIMKDMIKNFQSKSQKSQNNPQTQKSVKLPPISGESNKKSNISVKFREPSQNSLNSLERVDSFVSGRTRKPTPVGSRRNFKSLFLSNDEGPESPSMIPSPGLRSPRFEAGKKIEENKDFIENEKIYRKPSNERKARTKSSKIGEIFKEIPQKRLEFDEDRLEKAQKREKEEVYAKKKVSFRDDYENFQEKLQGEQSEEDSNETKHKNEVSDSKENIDYDEDFYDESFAE